MLDNLLHIVGVDLQGQLARLTAQANAFKESTKREIREEVASTGITAALWFGFVLALAAACTIGLIALYIWLEPQYGALTSLAMVGGVTALVALVLMSIAISRGASREDAANLAQPIETVVAAAPRPALNATPMVAALPADASLLDVLTHRVSSRAAGAADEAIEAAHDAVAHGSRSALIGTLATTILIGYVIGRRGAI